MSFVLNKVTVVGLLAGLVVPPVLTKLILEPSFIHSKFDEIDNIKSDLDHIGWHVRNLEESKGLKGEEVYIPTTYFQARY